MSLVIYLKNFKVLVEKEFTPEDGGDEAFYKNIGARLVKQGARAQASRKTSLASIQKKKLYKMKPSDQDYYVCCCLALWKLNIYSPCSATDPIWIAPIRRRRSRKKH